MVRRCRLMCRAGVGPFAGSGVRSVAGTTNREGKYCLVIDCPPTHRGQAVAPRRRGRRGEEGTGALPGDKLFKSYVHPADSGDGSSCFYGPVQASHAEHEHIPRMHQGATMGPREAITTASDPASVMERVLAEALTLIPSAEGAVIELFNELGSLVITAASGNVAESVGSVVSVAHSLSGLAIRSGVTQCCEDATTDPRVDTTLAGDLGILSMICMPLGRGDQRLGVLSYTH